MKLYYSNLAGVKFAPDEIKPVGVLESYANTKHPKPIAWSDAYFMDSGAFSVWRSGKTVKLDDYIVFLKEYRALFTVYAALDVIGDPEASFRNYAKMREADLLPMPAFHFGAQPKWLDEYAKLTDHIGVGGIAMMSKKDRAAFLRGIFQRYPDPSKVGFHGFGINDQEILTTFPWKTADATSIHLRARLGGIWARDGWVRICAQEKAIYSDAKVQQNEKAALQSLVEGLGFDWALATTWSPEGDKERCKVSIAQFEALIAPKLYTTTHNTFQF